MVEYKTKITDAKISEVNELKDRLGSMQGFVFTDFRGLTVDQITRLRTQLRKHEAEYTVVRNRYAKLAFKQLDAPDVSHLLTGPTALAMSQGKLAGIVKTLFDFGKESSVQVKGAIIDGVVFDRTQTEAYSKLPSWEELIAKLMGTMKAPVQHLTYAINGVPQKLVRTLQAVADKKAQS